MTATGRLLGGEVVVNGTSIVCVGCDCSAEAADATVLDCPSALITPGLINPHDHLGWAQHPPVEHGTERYDHRHEWRKGKNGHTKLSTAGNFSNHGESWGEMRMVIAGATSMMGSGGSGGFTRNLDRDNLLEGLVHGVPDAPTFPLGDTSGVLINAGCDYNKLPNASQRASAVAYVPHVAEGVVDAARNEFLCLAGEVAGSTDVVMDNAAFIHGIGLTTPDVGLMAADSAGLVWSPRSNVSLYGFTAEVGVYDRLGVLIALGSDWAPSGSINLLRELQCADGLNRDHYNGYFSDRALVEMVTHNAAELSGFADTLGTLQVGRLADIAIFDASQNAGYRAVIDAEPADVALVLRGGTALYGDTALVDALAAADGCDILDICGREKRICAQRETGSTFSQIVDSMTGGSGYTTYPLFFCGIPDNEPTCVPSRPDEFTGVTTADDQDGDGIADALDNCPNWFNPPRPMDDGMQPNQDGDADGDACDPCPFDPDTTSCTSVDPVDLDGDGVPNIQDNCPGDANPDQANADGDLRGDVCDDCPQEADPCASSVYDIKQGLVTEGTAVRLPGLVVTGIYESGYFLQHPPETAGYQGAEYSGIFAYDAVNAAVLQIGDHVDVESAKVGNYFGQRQITNPVLTVQAAPIAVPAPVVAEPGQLATGGELADAMEGVLVRVVDVEVLELEPPTDESAPTLEFTITGGLHVDDLFYLLSPDVGDTYEQITGILRWSWSHTMLEPRGPDDVSVGAPKLKTFLPALVYANEGTTGATTPSWTLSLSGPAVETVTIEVVSSMPAIAQPAQASYTISAGWQTVDVEVIALVGDPTPVVFTATSGNAQVQASVRVIGAAETPAVTSLLPASGDLSFGDTLEMTATLDLPAGPGGYEVVLSAEPTGLVTLPASVFVPAGTNQISFDVGALAAAGTVSISAAGLAGTGGMATSVLNIVEPVPIELALVEIFYDAESGDDTFEWIKLYNGSGETLDLSGYSVGWGGNDYTSGIVSLTGSLAPGACFVVGGPVSDGTNGNPVYDQVYDLEPDLQNSGSTADGVAVFNMASGNVDESTVPVDAVIYGSSNTNNLIDTTGSPGLPHVGDAPKGQSILRLSVDSWTINPTPNATACPTL
jgi:imidazolonepropionase-like amidohydrolase